MAHETERRPFGREEPLVLARVRDMAEVTIARLEGRVNLGSLEAAEHDPMTSKTELVLGLEKNRLGVARVRAVATGAITCGHGLVQVGLVKFFLLVAVTRVAERLHRRREKSCFVRPVGVVAQGALFGAKGPMNGDAFQLGRFGLMTREAKLSGRRGHQKPVIFRRMRVVA